MGDKDPKNIDKLKVQSDGKREEALEYKHDTPAEKEQDKEREDAIKETRIDREYGVEVETTE